MMVSFSISKARLASSGYPCMLSVSQKQGVFQKTPLIASISLIYAKDTLYQI